MIPKCIIYKHIIKVVLRHIFPDFTNFPEQTKFSDTSMTPWPLYNSPTSAGFQVLHKKSDNLVSTPETAISSSWKF